MRVGLGLAALGRPGYINLQRDSHLTSRSVEGMQQQANAVMDELFYQSRSLSKKQNDDRGLRSLKTQRKGHYNKKKINITTSIGKSGFFLINNIVERFVVMLL